VTSARRDSPSNGERRRAKAPPVRLAANIKWTKRSNNDDRRRRQRRRRRRKRREIQGALTLTAVVAFLFPGGRPVGSAGPPLSRASSFPFAEHLTNGLAAGLSFVGTGKPKAMHVRVEREGQERKPDVRPLKSLLRAEKTLRFRGEPQVPCACAQRTKKCPQLLRLKSPSSEARRLVSGERSPKGSGNG